MSVQITVNGVTYDSVDAMPPDARRVYEESLKLPGLADRDGDGTPDIVQRGAEWAIHRATTQKKFIVNGTEYADESAMPPDVRQVYEAAMQKLKSGDPTVKKNEIKFSFSVTGPGFSFRRSVGNMDPSGSQPQGPSPGAPSPTNFNPPGAPRPIEPASMRGISWFAFLLSACGAAAIAYWLVTRVR